MTIQRSGVYHGILRVDSLFLGLKEADILMNSYYIPQQDNITNTEVSEGVLGPSWKQRAIGPASGFRVSIIMYIDSTYNIQLGA